MKHKYIPPKPKLTRKLDLYSILFRTTERGYYIVTQGIIRTSNKPNISYEVALSSGLLSKLATKLDEFNNEVAQVTNIYDEFYTELNNLKNGYPGN